MRVKSNETRVCHQFVTPIGALNVIASERGLVSIQWPSAKSQSSGTEVEQDDSLKEIVEQSRLQIDQYFQKKRRQFELRLHPAGTAFQQLVWKEMEKIPYGETRSYKDIAIALGDANKARAVGGAANKNPLPIVIPCHRIVGSDGSLTGFAGGLEIKKFLLELEADQKENYLKK